jgi:hypothetical protein
MADITPNRFEYDSITVEVPDTIGAGTYSIDYTSSNSTDSQSFTVVDDSSLPATDITLSNNSIVDTVQDNDLVATITNNDPDSVSFIYTLLNDSSGRFIISGDELRIGNSSTITNSDISYSITIQVDDGSGGIFSEDFTILVQNNLPLDILISNSIISNTASVNDVVGTLSTVDEDDQDTFTYELLNNGDGKFGIINDEIIVVDNNFTTSSYSIEVRSTDNKGDSVTKVLYIDVTEALTIQSVTDLGYFNDRYNVRLDFNGSLYNRSLTTESIGSLEGLNNDRLEYSKFIYRSGYIYAFYGATIGDEFSYTNSVAKYQVNNNGNLEFVSNIVNTSNRITSAILSSDNNIYFIGMDFVSGGTYFTSSKLYRIDSLDNVTSTGDIVEYRPGDENLAGTESYDFPMITEYNGNIYALGNFFNGLDSVVSILKFPLNDFSSITRVYLPSDYVSSGNSITKLRSLGFVNLNDKLFIVDHGFTSPDVYELTDELNDTWSMISVTLPSSSLYIDTLTVSNVTSAVIYDSTGEYYTSRDLINWNIVVDNNLVDGIYYNNSLKTRYSMGSNGNVSDDSFILSSFGIETDGLLKYHTVDNAYVPISKNYLSTGSIITYYGDNNEYIIYTDSTRKNIKTTSVLPEVMIDGSYKSYQVNDISSSHMVISFNEDLSQNNVVEYTVLSNGLSGNYLYDFNVAPTDISINNNEFYEDVSNGHIIGELSTSDTNALDIHTYSIVGGSSIFSIQNNNELVVTDNSTIDYSTTSSYDINIRVTDNGGLSFEKVITLVVIERIYSPSDITLSNYNVPDNANDNDFVGNIIVTDSDLPNDSHTFKLIDSANGLFRLYNSAIYVNDASRLDGLVSDKHTIRLRATDSNGLSITKDIDILVDYINYAPSDIILSNSVVSKDVSDNYSIGKFTTIDQNPSDKHTYRLDSDDLGAFIISGDELIVYRSALLDNNYSGLSQNTYDITVTTTDTSGESYQKVFTITVTESNQNPLMASISYNLFDNANVGDLVGTIQANDNDGTIVDYSIVSGNTNSTFNIVNNSGTCEVYLANQLDTSISKYTLLIRATDNQGLTTTSNFLVYVNYRNITITSIDPLDGSYEVGKRVKIMGSGFTSNVTVVFNGIPTKIDTLVSTNEIVVTIPKGSTSGGVKVIL